MAYSNSAVRLTGLLKRCSQVDWPTQTVQSGWLAYSDGAVRLTGLLKRCSQVYWPTQIAQSGWLAYSKSAVKLTGLLKECSQADWPSCIRPRCLYPQERKMVLLTHWFPLYNFINASITSQLTDWFFFNRRFSKCVVYVAWLTKHRRCLP